VGINTVGINTVGIKTVGNDAMMIHDRRWLGYDIGEGYGGTLRGSGFIA
jgi:hypothetical protein